MTWEVVIGAFSATLFSTIAVLRFIEQYEMMVCPQVGFHLAFKSCTLASI